MTIVYILVAILIFGVLIAVHELGHFLAAKGCGVQVNEFSIGMGPALWHHQKGETQYSIRAFPIGGYCAMEGEEENSNNPRALNQQGFWKKLVIFIAGAAMNFLTGLIILLVLYSGAKGFYTPKITGFAPEYAQQETDGLQKGDVIRSINGERIYLYSDLGLLLSLNKGNTANFIVSRNGEKITLNAVPVKQQTYTANDGKTQYTGYGLYFGNVEKATIGAKIRYSWLNAMDFVREVRLSLQLLVTGGVSINDFQGPVGIVSTITKVGKQSASVKAAAENIFYLTSLIAVNLAVMNLLPIPALDGGHILFLIFGEISVFLFKKKIPDKYEAAINMVFLVALMGFMLLITFHDVFRLFK